MKLHGVLFGLLLAMCAVITVFFFIEEVPFEEAPGGAQGEKVYLGHGVTHERFPSMDQGGSGEARHEKIFWPALAFGVLQLAFMVALMIFGARREERAGPLLTPLVIGGALWIVVFTLLMLSYRGFMGEGEHALILGFPAPTAWFIYGFWPFQVFFVVVYIMAFNRLLITDDDMARFQEILAAKKRQDGGSA